MSDAGHGTKGKVKVALIGAGAMANSVHYPSLVELEDVELVGLCDMVPEKLQATAKKFGIGRTFSDYRRMLDETKPDAVYALMPPHHLFDVAMDVMERGHDLFVEKPPALTTRQTVSLARAAEAGKRVTGVGFQRRYHPLFGRCRQQIDKHGKPHQAVAAFYKSAAPAAVHPYYRGATDILTSDAIHVVDLLRFHCGGNVASIVSDVRKLDCWYEVCFNALIRFDNGATGVLLTNWRTGVRRLTLELHSFGCSTYADADGEARVYEDNAKEPTAILNWKQVAGSDAQHVNQGFKAQARAFIDGVKSRVPPHNNLSDSVKTMQLVDLIYSSDIGTKAV